MALDNQSPAEPMPEPALLALARKKFGVLSRAEDELFQATQEGRATSALTAEEEKNDPANAADWPADRVVRANCIAWVCTDPEASALVTYRGLALYGMRIDGALDLGNAEIKSPFLAWKCAFPEDISLQDAQLRGFYLVGCQIKSLKAGRAIFDGSVLLRDGFKAEGEVNFVGAKIHGVLDCSDAQFSNASGFALIADGAKIEGGVFLRGGFKAQGEVNFLMAAIGGNLDCAGAQFSNANALALTANQSQVEGSVFLRNNFKAEGEVNLASAKIARHFDCSRAQFSNPKRVALTANASKIGGYVFLRNGSNAEGEVNLVGATLGGLDIHEVIEADKMILNLRLAQVGTLWDDEKSWPRAGNLFLDGFRYERLYEAAPFEADSRKKWLSLQPRDRFRPQPYEQLAAVLRQMGHERDARLVTIEKNHERASFTRFRQQGWWWYNLFGKLIGYGYRPGLAFCISLAMILLGTIVFYLGSTHGLISPTSDKAYAKAPNGQMIIENGQQKISDEYPAFHSFFYSLESFTPLLALDQSANWMPNANRATEISDLNWKVPTGSILRYYLYFHIAAGWLLTSLWVGAITGLVKT